jgi:hypothetical protein
MVCGAALAVRNDTARYSDWRAGAYEPKFGNAVESLATDRRLAGIDRRLGSAGLFGRNPDGIVQDTYRKLCRYAHSRAAYTNYDIWQSNGRCSLERHSRSSGSTTATLSRSATCF